MLDLQQKKINVYLYILNFTPNIRDLSRDVLESLRKENLCGMLIIRNRKYYFVFTEKLIQKLYKSPSSRPLYFLGFKRLETNRLRNPVSKDYLYSQNIYSIGDNYKFTGYYYKDIYDYIIK